MRASVLRQSFGPHFHIGWPGMASSLAALQLPAEHRRKTTFASSLQQSLAQAEAGQQPHQGDMGLEEGLQYVIVTNAENPVLVFSFR